MSREEAEQEESKSKSDDMRLQLALQKSKEEVASGDAATVSEGDGGFSKSSKNPNSKPSKDLLDLDFGNPVAQPPPPQRTAASSSVDPWGMPVQQQTQPPPQQLDPWGGATSAAGASAAAPTVSDPWSPVKEPPRVSPQPAPNSKFFYKIL